MPKVKIDAVIDAVRYDPGGRIEAVRLYDRRGPVWSDQMLVGRGELVERLEKGNRLVAGRRQSLLGGVFETGAAVWLEGGRVVTSGDTPAGKDSLAGVPVF